MERFKEVKAKFLNYEIDSSFVRLTWTYDVHGRSYSDSANIYMRLAQEKDAQRLFYIAFWCAKNEKDNEITVLYANDIPVGIKSRLNAGFITWRGKAGRIRINEYMEGKK